MEKTTTQELLAQAEKICAQRNVRLTPQRLEVLRLMSLQDGAISAYDLLDLLICDRCGAVKEECAEGVEDIMHTLAAKMGFALRHNVIEAHGLCAACVEVEACRHPEQCQHDHSVQVKKKPR
ncbi:MAG: transcriptional regulator Zur [Escherichia coli]|nr:transcriptional regulator Zur [Escherichia coli]